MSDHLRIVREGFERGDPVLVAGHGPNPRPARVIEVLRGALRYQYTDKPERVVRTAMFKYVSHAQDAPPPPAAAPPPPPAAPAPRFRGPDRKPRKSPQPAPRTPRPPQEALPLPAAQRPPSSLSAADDVQSWLELGRELGSKIRAEAEALEANAQALREDAAQLLEQASADEKVAQEIRGRIAQLEAVALP